MYLFMVTVGNPKVLSSGDDVVSDAHQSATATPYIAFREHKSVITQRIALRDSWINTFHGAVTLAILAPVAPPYQPRLPEASYNRFTLERAASGSRVTLNVP